MGNHKYMSTTEVAELLGVHRQTVINYVNRGILKEYDKGTSKGPHKICRSSVESFMESGKDIIDLNNELSQLRSDINNELNELKEIREGIKLQKDLYELMMSRNDMSYSITSLISDLCSLIDNVELDHIDENIICSLINNRPVKEICEMHNISMNRIYQTLYKVRSSIRGIEKFMNSVKSLSELDSLNRYYKFRINYLESELNKFGVSYLTQDELTVGIPKSLFGLYNLGHRTRKIISIEFNDVKHIYDLVSKTRRDLLQIRNFGRKSLEELELYLAKYNLKLGDPESLLTVSNPDNEELISIDITSIIHPKSRG